MFFPVITKNLKWEFLTKNLVTFKKWDRVKMKFLGGGAHQKSIYGWELPKKRCLDSLQIKWGIWKKRGG